MKRKIKSLQELKREQHKLKVQAEASKQLFVESLSQARKETVDFALNKVLPAGAAGAAIWGAKKVFGSNGNGDKTVPSTDGQSVLAALLPKLLPLGISLFNAYWTKEMAEQENAI